MTQKAKIEENEIIDSFFLDLQKEFPIKFDSMWDAFAKEGNLLSMHIASKYKQVDAVDILDYSETYKKNIRHPNAKFHVMDNLNFISGCKKSYDLILLDSPMCELGEGTAEHFGIMDRIVPLARSQGFTVLIFNTSLEPYDYDAEKNSNWKEIRNKFYGKTDTSKLSYRFFIPFYIRYLYQAGLKVVYYHRYARRTTELGDKTSIDLNLLVVQRLK